MSEVFYNPYQFIPVDTRKAKQLTAWSQPKDPSQPLARPNNHAVRHDYWHTQGLSGRIRCSLTTLSPTVVGGQQNSKEKSQDPQATVVEPYRSKGQLALPANSLRGLIASTVEILSQSSLRVLTKVAEGGYSNRKKAEQALTLKGVLCQNRQCIQDKTTQALIPVSSKAIAVLENMMRSLVEHEQPSKREQKQRDILRKFNKNNVPRGWVRNQDNTFSSLVLDGDHLFYAMEGSEVVELSYSSIWRKAVEGDLFAAFKRASGENSLPWYAERQALTPAEAMFGVVEDQPDKQQGGRHLASRVRFSDALPVQAVNLPEPITLKILNSPKPPSPAMYFSGNGYVAKTALNLKHDKPNGRKYYLPHPDSLKAVPVEHWQTNDEHDNAQMKLKVQPIPPQTQFQFDIQFENLSKAELGLLLTALQPCLDASQFVHRLGLGKPLGLGHVWIEPQVEIIERAQRYEFDQWAQPRYTAKPLADYQNDSLVVSETLKTFLQWSNPKQIGATPVCYPYVSEYKQARQQAYEETEGFQWFVRNESTNKKETLNKQAISHKTRTGLKS